MNTTFPIKVSLLTRIEVPRLTSIEDAKILQDVQRALKLKARREARLKSNPNPEVAAASSSAATSAARTSPVKQAFPSVIPLPTIESTPPNRGGNKVTNHPLPSSSDEGTTLDWSGLGGEEDKSERRWTMSITKKRDREKQPSDITVETRETMHAAKLAKFRSRMSPKALERAANVRDQLGRRYNLVFNAQSAGSLNPAHVVQWFANQNSSIRASLEQAEPLTWLRDYDKSKKQKQRSPWHISALIAEEYLQHLRGTIRAPLIPNHVEILNSSPNLSISSPQPYPSPHGSSYFVLGPSLGRKPSKEEEIPPALEPSIEFGRKSIDRESRRSVESGYSSLLSLPRVLASPSSPQFRPRVDSDRSSLSEHSDDGARRKKHVPAPLNRDILSSTTIKSGSRSLELRSILSPIPDDQRPEENEPSSSVERLSTDLPPTAINSHFSQPKVRISLPSKEELRVRLEEKRQHEADEEASNREYELKQRLLETTTAQNTRIRQLLNHISAGVREYDQIQTSLSNSLQLPYKNLPRELVDAFSHDPAAVTGATRKYQGWRAVDDIHHRVVRQREIFRDYLSSVSPTPIISESVLDNPITALSDTLHALEAERRDIAWRATEVFDKLRQVQVVHADVKTAYNDTMSHTSVIYPEISTIVALEESYKDQYQYFWDVAMDVLTLFLDTVTPFWRTYGKTIGDDIQHFLIIPLYRNEFTGQTKRYSIDRFPRRSLRHWVGLLVFFVGSVAGLVLQTKGAVTSICNFWLLSVPYPYLRLVMLGPFWITIIVQWWAVVVELAIVLTQFAIVAWWIGWSVNIFT
ncbi:hypothetical protein MIND_00502900 [Mycena indigotica]|uniref:Uncharacterized protein n=1 Tax=Mycena indigotica TaxID=2126181 RepID=A0A8H6W8M8_9AGAR|nr:uncharacterized protein MIND_00502900 [Mycena indigotica]KAF7307096.1 hypothetical protein MIND_00502900 [Mycena indigotica]